VIRSAFAVRLPPTFDFVMTRRRDRWNVKPWTVESLNRWIGTFAAQPREARLAVDLVSNLKPAQSALAEAFATLPPAAAELRLVRWSIA